jgi:iron(III) transport system permease protein
VSFPSSLPLALGGRRHGRRAPAILWVPGLLVAAASLIPAWYLVVRSTESGWAPWREALEQSAAPLMARSLGLAAAVSVLVVAIALPAAWLTTRAALPGRRLWSVALALPLAIPSYVMALTVVAALGPRGMLQGWLEPLGVQRLPEIYGFWGATLTLAAVTFPYLFLVLRAAFRALDASEEEASRSLGVGPWRTFARVTLPPLRPSLAAGLLLVVLYVLSDFGAVSVLRYDSFTRVIFIHYQTSFDRTSAAVLGSMLAMLTALILAIELGVRARSQERLRLRRQRPAKPVQLGRWLWPAMAFLGFVVLATLVAPLGVLVYWVAKGLAADAHFPSLWSPLRHSALMAAGGAAVTVALALPIAILSTRYRGAASKLIEQAAYLTHALPGLVVALALVFFGIRYAGPLYQTVWLLLAAYVVLFLPNALSALRGPLLRQGANLEEAAAGLGRRPLAVLATVTLPLARPGIAAGLALVFLTIIKELPATLLLSPPGFTTLAGVIWGLSTDVSFAGAALASLILVAVAAVPVAILAWKGDMEQFDVEA